MKELEDMIRERFEAINIDGIEQARNEQKHLYEGSSERVYWHYGYAMALRDILRIFEAGSGAPN
jgi:hypothetical protein